MTHSRVAVLGVVGLAIGFGAPASGQAIVDTGGQRASYPAPAWMEALLPDPNDPRVRAYYAKQRELRRTKVEMQRFRREYFGAIRDVERRQVGLALLRERYHGPDYYPLLLEVFEHDKPDVRFGILDMFADQKNDDGDVALAWQSVFEDDDEVRAGAAERLFARVGETGEVSERIKMVVGAGLQNERNSEVIAAAGVAEMLNIYEMVPLMIAAQVAGGGGGGAGERQGNLGWIMIAQQQAFVSDLQPVVSDSAVGFDPTLSVVTEGVVLEINDASVITYRTEVFYSLQRMTSAAMGRTTGGMGLNQPAWWEWYEDEWKPFLAARDADKAETADG